MAMRCIAAAKGLKWDSPRGPMSIDPETRDVVQTIYIRKVEKVGGEPQNVEFDKVENVKDPVKARSGEVISNRERTSTAQLYDGLLRLQCIAETGENALMRRRSLDRLLPRRLCCRRAAHAAQPGPIKIGVIMSYSGQFADPGGQIDNGIKLYMKQNGDTVAGKKIELIRKDTGGIAPDVAKRLAQELIVRDKRRHPRRLRC